MENKKRLSLLQNVKIIINDIQMNYIYGEMLNAIVVKKNFQILA